MSEVKKSFLDSPFYPIIFMLVITVVFVGVLAVLYRSTEKGIEAFRQQTYQLQILSLFADTLSTVTGQKPAAFLDRTTIKANFEKYVQVKKLPMPENNIINKEYYAVSDGNGKLIGHCFDITGSGLWGTMRGLLALSPDFKTIINFAIYDQMETPGLGARVEEDWFKKQFGGKPFGTGSQSISFSLVPEAASAGKAEVRQITGATITSSSVLKMIKATAEQFGSNPTSQQW
jgi:Na+-transporting NADH:ubiquinone oxidoreductase subunit C